MSTISRTLASGYVGAQGNLVSILGCPSVSKVKFVIDKIQFLNVSADDVTMNLRLFRSGISTPLVTPDMTVSRGSVDILDEGQTIVLEPNDYISANCSTDNTLSMLITGREETI